MGEAKPKLLTAEQILESTDIREEIVDVSQWWGGAVKIRTLTKAQQQEARKKAIAHGDELDANVAELELFRAGVIEPVFTDDQLEKLREKAAAPFDKILKAITADVMDEEEAKSAKKLFRA